VHSTPELSLNNLVYRNKLTMDIDNDDLLIPTDYNDKTENQVQQRIEQMLSSNKLGTVKLYFTDMTFEWNEGVNRSVHRSARAKPLRDSMKLGIFRYDIAHRIAGCLSRSVFELCLYHPEQINTKIAFADMETLNANAEFPLLRLNSIHKVEMQSGQHRMSILQDLCPNLQDHWWIVDIYDDRIRKLPSHANLFLELPILARYQLRRNEDAPQVTETEAQIWLQIDDFRNARDRSFAVGHTAQFQLNRSHYRRTLAQLSNKSRQLFSIDEYRLTIIDILRKFPGLRDDFKARPLDTFIKGRAVQV
jgi:Protein of unknown function (DUF3723)